MSDTPSPLRAAPLHDVEARVSERALLIAVDTDEPTPLFSVRESLDELGELALTAGAGVAGAVMQRLPSPDTATYVGKGKVREIADQRIEAGCNLIITDDELSPAQLRGLEQALECKVIDRAQLILDIFASRARSREGRLQVELAQLEYQLPRLAGIWHGLSRLGGGIGTRGPGETKLETDRRVVRKRISELRDQLTQVEQQRAVHRRQRVAQLLPTVALVGYTNAGKSTLFNQLASARVLAEHKLFATLDPTTRKVLLPGGQEVLLSDTVGFIQKLPAQLAAAFRATLEEVTEADVLVHVVDSSHPQAVAQTETVQAVLRDLGANDLPMVTVLNKIDLLAPEDQASIPPDPFTVLVSALRSWGCDRLLDAIELALSREMVDIRVRIPFKHGDLVDLFHRRGVITNERYVATGTEIVGRVSRPLAGVFRGYVY